MYFFRIYRRLIASLTTLAFIFLHIAPLQAAMIDNQELLFEAQQQYNKQELKNLLEREDVQQQLINLGVDPDDARSRVDQMTDREIAQLNQHLEDMPAGSGILGLLLVLFIVFVITDMLGATDVFPFVNKI